MEQIPTFKRIATLWFRCRDLRRQEVGFDVSGIEKSVCGAVEDGEGAGLAGAAAGGSEIDLGGRVGQCEGLARAQLIEGLRAI